MPSVICPCVDCVHHPKRSNHCSAEKINLSERWMHTDSGDFQHFLVCKAFKANNKYNQFIYDLRMALGDPEEESN